MTVYAKHFSTKQTPQSESIPGKPMVPNSAGGFSFAVDDWKRLDRFLLLGNEGGSYYASEQKLTVESAQAVLRCLVVDSKRTIDRIVEISEAGRAPKNDPAIFALALCASWVHEDPDLVGHKIWRQYALNMVPRVCRIGTHLFQFAETVQALRGWGRGLRKAVANWYLTKKPRDLAYQVTKYQQRNGWSHRDLLRLSHARPDQSAVMEPLDTNSIFHWVVKGWSAVGDQPHDRAAILPIWAKEKAKLATDKKEVARLIRDYDLVRECIPTQFLTEPEVWEALLEKMPLMALVRNLATMTRIGLLAPMSNAVGKIVGDLADKDRIKKSRLHPVAILNALRVYAAGRGERGQNTWTPVPQVIDALDQAFYLAFDNVEPTGKRWYLGCDVSGSMWGSRIAGTSLTAAEGTAALALVTASVEPNWYLAAFNTEMIPFSLTPRSRLDMAMQYMQGIPWGGTDCAKPMLHALANQIPVDIFVVLTDSETWAGHIHPTQALQQYRNKMGIPAKLIVVGMAANSFSIADPSDSGQLDVVGFDTNVPALMADFAKE